MSAKRKLLIFGMITCGFSGAAALAQEVPGTVIFRAVPKDDAAPAPAEEPVAPPAPPKAPEKPTVKAPEKPTTASPAPAAGEEEQQEAPLRRAPSMQRKRVLPPEEMEPKPEPEKPVPEGRVPVSLVDASPVVFSLADIAVYPWQVKEEYFEDDPAKVIRLKAKIQRGDDVTTPDQLTKMPFPDGQGVLTIFHQNQFAEIPLAKILISQDIIFLDEEGIITQLVYKTEPKGKKPVFSKTEVRSVLQMNSGSIKRYGLKTGDKIAIPPR